MNTKIKIMLVEDNPEFRDVVAFTLSDEPDIELQSQFGTADFALRSLQDRSTRKVPDLILLDLNLPGTPGLEAIPWFKEAVPDAEIIILTQSDREADVLTAIHSGASGYLLKESTLDQITVGIRTVMNGGASLDPSMAKYLINHHKKQPTPKAEQELLSPRQLEILTCIADGKMQKEIADELNISTKTVETHIRHIYEKLNVQNAPAAISKAYKAGLFPRDG
ncbi:response regulator transcription factor [Pontiellaceae bacterium B12227]|nr:response regulator transcription factor [Pontiellaceae bacterium B12227]